jgi:hypothetical protein
VRRFLERRWLRDRPEARFSDEEWRRTLRSKARVSWWVLLYMGLPLSAVLLGLLAIGYAGDILPLPLAPSAVAAVALSLGISLVIAVAAFLSPLGTGKAVLYDYGVVRPPSKP